MSQSGPSLKGGCACGAFRWQSDAKPTFSFLCQCRDCQQATGTGHAASFIIPAKTMKTEGDLSWYERTVESGNIISQRFCGTCGSPVMNRNSCYPDSAFIHAASLDDPEQFHPQKVVYRNAGPSWDLSDPEA